MTYTSPTAADYAIAHALHQEDIDSVSGQNEWLTMNAIHTIIDEHITTTPQDIAYVDPLWFQDWINNMYKPIPRPDPPFFTDPMGNGRRPVALAMPMHVSGNHYITIFMSLRGNSAMVYDSMGGRGDQVSDYIVRILTRFNRLFGKFFTKNVNDKFRVSKATMVAQQTDGCSCGIYTVRNTLDLLDNTAPRMLPMSSTEIAVFRAKATTTLENRKMAEDLAYAKRMLSYDEIYRYR